MALGGYDSRSATVQCSVDECNTRIFKDRASYAAHMVASHSATDTDFADIRVRGVNGFDFSADGGGNVPVRFREEHVKLWCGCGATFVDLTSLQDHQIAEHGVSFP